MEISFYQTAEGTLISSIIRLLEKIYTSGQRCIFFSPLEERVKIIDKTLWTFSTDSFIPHGDRSLGFPEKQPIYFTSQPENPNNAQILMLVDTFEYKGHADFEKIIFIFENKQQEENALALYNDLKKNKENVNYWKRSPQGWEKQI
ncbi:MAG: DNA polymerase III subunit chi [Holosporaceae bacterium]|jgi:DNA polymerase-3 subunit chi|nr:DNA polymerase III subunit chi [Holosporaceae bacterium]